MLYYLNLILNMLELLFIQQKRHYYVFNNESTIPEVFINRHQDQRKSPVRGKPMTHTSVLRSTEKDLIWEDAETLCCTCYFFLPNYHWYHYESHRVPKAPEASCPHWAPQQIQSIRIPI